VAGNDIAERLADNEARFRAINDRIEAGHELSLPDERAVFLCECARLGCNATIEMALREYSAVRANPRRFFVLPGHELSELEDVVEVHPDFLVVEKFGSAGREAQATASEADDED
jgi:hypothetical protein